MTFVGNFIICLSIFISVAGVVHGQDVNCTKIGVFDKCCETDGCLFVNCTDEIKCEFEHEDWKQVTGCEEATNQCPTLMTGNSSTVIPLNTTDQPPTANTSVNPTTSEDNTTTVNYTTTGDVSENGTSTVTEPVTEPITTVNVTTPDTNTTDSNSTGATMPPTTANLFTTENMTTGIDTVAPPVPVCGRKFDAASFIGGMVLMLGVLSIVFFSCKYYKSRTEARYSQF